VKRKDGTTEEGRSEDRSRKIVPGKRKDGTTKDGRRRLFSELFSEKREEEEEVSVERNQDESFRRNEKKKKKYRWSEIEYKKKKGQSQLGELFQEKTVLGKNRSQEKWNKRRNGKG